MDDEHKNKILFFVVCIFAVMAIVVLVKYGSPRAYAPQEQIVGDDLAEIDGTLQVDETAGWQIKENNGFPFPESAGESNEIEGIDENNTQTAPPNTVPCGPNNKGYCKLLIGKCNNGFSAYVGSENECKDKDKSCCIPV